MQTMKRILTIMLMATALVLSSCASPNGKLSESRDATDSKILITYFSATGNTAEVAKSLAELLETDICEIVPEELYSDADLNWHNEQSRSSVEMKDSLSRPAIKKITKDLGDYDVVLIGYPIWWNLAPRVINTFIENNDLKGKEILLFATSGGSDIDNSMNVLRTTYPHLNIVDGMLLNDSIQYKNIEMALNEK
jgi:multimeric flavodoxin WrbA